MEQGTMQMDTMRYPERYGMSKEEQSLPHSKTRSLERMQRSNLSFSPAQVHVNQVYYPPPGTANAFGYNGRPMAEVAQPPPNMYSNAYGYNDMPMAEVAQPPPNMYSYAGMPMAEAALAPRPDTQDHGSSGWCEFCCGPCARWSKKCWIILLVLAVIAFVLVVTLVLTVAVENGKHGEGYGG